MFKQQGLREENKLWGQEQKTGALTHKTTNLHLEEECSTLKTTYTHVYFLQMEWKFRFVPDAPESQSFLDTLPY